MIEYRAPRFKWNYFLMLLSPNEDYEIKSTFYSLLYT